MNVNELIEQYENDLKREDKRIDEGFARLFDELTTDIFSGPKPTFSMAHNVG